MSISERDAQRPPDFSLIGTQPAMALHSSSVDPIVDSVRHKLAEAHGVGDTVAFAVSQKLLARSLVGQREYGAKLTREDLSERDWLNHAQTEAMDLANYLEVLIQRPGSHPRLITLPCDTLNTACELEVLLQRL